YLRMPRGRRWSLQGCSYVRPSRARRRLRQAHAGAPVQTNGLAFHNPVLILDDKTPGKCVGAGRALVAPRPAHKGPGNFVFGGRTFSLQLAENLVAVLIGPDRAANHAGGGVVE